MKYISHFLRHQVRYQKDHQGILADWIMTASPSHAVLSGLLIEDTEGSEAMVPMSEVESLGARYVYLKLPLARCRRFVPSDENIFLARHILDRQVIDTRKKKVFRVNDIEVQEENGQYAVRWVDAGLSGLLQRFGFTMRMPQRLARLQKRIAWADIEPLDPDLQSAFAKLSRLHPADIADIVEELGVSKGADLIERLDAETAAETLTEVDPRMQTEIVEEIEPEEAADIIEEMEPDDAADLMADLPRDTAREIMDEMQTEEKHEVQELLQYPEDSAGGIMNTEYLSVTASMTAGQVLTKFRADKPQPEVAYNIVVTDDNNLLSGLLSLRDLVVAEPGIRIDSIMMAGLPPVTADATLEDVADLMHKYDLVALPVVDDRRAVMGVITVDDVMERMVPEKWKRSNRRRFPFPL